MSVLLLLLSPLFYFIYAAAIGYKVCLTLATRLRPVYCSHLTNSWPMSITKSVRT